MPFFIMESRTKGIIGNKAAKGGQSGQVIDLFERIDVEFYKSYLGPLISYVKMTKVQAKNCWTVSFQLKKISKLSKHSWKKMRIGRSMNTK